MRHENKRPDARASRTRLWLACSISIVALPGAAADDFVISVPNGAGFVVKTLSSSVDSFRVDSITGNISRNGALFIHTTGFASLFVGASAGNTAVTGAQNTGIGFGALTGITSGSNNSAFGASALSLNGSGSNNSAFGGLALSANTTGGRNSAFGAHALQYVNGAENSAFGYKALQGPAITASSYNSAFGAHALEDNTGLSNSAFGASSLRYNTAGNGNSAFGSDALRYSTASFNSAFGNAALRGNMAAAYNSAFGFQALGNNDGVEAVENSAFGANALADNTGGRFNSAFGVSAMHMNLTGEGNAAFGTRALRQSTGDRNSAFGMEALDANNGGGDDNVAFGHGALRSNFSGNNNIALGVNAGSQHTTGDNNIYIGNDGEVASESGQIRIGTVGTHTQAIIVGIHDNPSASGTGVLVNDDGVLGTIISSSRFKQDVRDMGAASDVLAKLHPVAFRYRKEVAGGDQSLQYGLIAEEVAEVAPDLVTRDAEGRPYSVRYHLLAPMLLNEVQGQQHAIAELETHLEGLEQRLDGTQGAR
jgi:hypothetical protein